jgi:hypothetical protein
VGARSRLRSPPHATAAVKAILTATSPILNEPDIPLLTRENTFDDE